MKCLKFSKNKPIDLDTAYDTITKNINDTLETNIDNESNDINIDETTMITIITMIMIMITIMMKMKNHMKIIICG